MCILGGQDGVGGIATRYGLDGPRIEPRWWRDFLCHPVPEAHPTSRTVGIRVSSRVKGPDSVLTIHFLMPGCEWVVSYNSASPLSA